MSVSLQRFPGNDSLLLSLQPLHFQHGVQTTVRLSIRPSSPVRPSEVLSIVDGEIQVVKGVMCRPIDDVLQPVTGNHIRVVNEHRPNVHGDKKGEVEVFLDREDVGEDVIGEGLEVAVDWVESVCGEGCGYDPPVVWFVNVLVDQRVVFPSMNPINAVISANEEPNGQTEI